MPDMGKKWLALSEKSSAGKLRIPAAGLNDGVSSLYRGTVYHPESGELLIREDTSGCSGEFPSAGGICPCSRTYSG
ncbi:MAG: hypothetical protein US15_C0042G0002 [Candidatus Moranbacteria bacterium GW2011_GWF1_36_4]|nr:MAG: hypothetical protein US15_C0042G0002 [Candidatus Moranbacteria bacterium GW2011_GWF1_36_4]KKQ21896.1 MAG: hypothetical protein US37_C0006G0024 [Candidatus Moranbacteria bacterium GW2011_GWF2_37_11]